MKVEIRKINTLNIFFMLSMVVPYIVVFFLIAVDLIKRQEVFNYFSYRILPFIFLVIPLIVIAVYRNNENYMVYHHVRDYIIFVVVSIYLTSLCQRLKYGPILVYNAIKNLFLILALVKIFILFYVNLFGANMVDILDFLTKKVGIPMMQINSQNQFVFRLQFPTEGVLPFLIYFVIKEVSQKFSWFKSLQLALLLISLLLTLSRAFWAIGIIYIFLAIIFETKNSAKFKIFITSCILTPILLLVTDFYSLLSEIIQTRFGSKASNLNYYSDLERSLQNRELWLHFFQDPILGKGLGYYIPNLIRDENDKYMYESQVLSYLMDFGLILFSLFLILVLYYSLSNNSKNLKSLLLSISFFSFWLILSSFNPLLLGISGAILIFFAFNASSFSEINFRN